MGYYYLTKRPAPFIGYNSDHFYDYKFQAKEKANGTSKCSVARENDRPQVR